MSEENTEIQKSIELVAEEIKIKTPTTYTSKVRKVKNKNELIEEYFTLCSKLEKTPDFTENKLKKTRKGQIEKYIEILKNPNATEEKPVVKTVDENGEVKKVFSKQKKKLLAKNLFRINASVTYGIEKVSTIYKEKSGVDLEGLTSDILANKKEQMDIFENMIEQYPEQCETWATPLAAYIGFMTSICAQRALLNRQQPLKKNALVQSPHGSALEKTKVNKKPNNRISTVRKTNRKPRTPKGSFVVATGQPIAPCPL